MSIFNGGKMICTYGILQKIYGFIVATAGKMCYNSGILRYFRK